MPHQDTPYPVRGHGQETEEFALVPSTRSSSQFFRASLKRRRSTLKAHREIRIEITLTDEHGEEVRLKQGVQVDVSIEADTDATLKKPKSSN